MTFAENVDWKVLRMLLALDKNGNLTKAAEQLCLTPSAVSHQISQLEDFLESQVFIRKTKPLIFTPVGKILLKLAQKMEHEYEETERKLAQVKDGFAGRLYIVIECHTCFQWLMPVLQEYRKHWPDAELDLSASFQFDALKSLEERKIDLVVTSDPTPSKKIEFFPLFSYEMMLTINKDSHLAKKNYLLPKDLVNEVLLTYPVEHHRLDIFSRFLQPAKVQPKKTREVELTMMMISMVSSGLGTAALPYWAIDEYIGKELIQAVSLGKDSLWSKLYLAVRKEETHLTYLKEFIEMAKQICFKNLKKIRSIEA